MPMADSQQGASRGVLGGLGSLVGRVLLVIAGALFFVSALVAAVIASVGLLLWSLLTGRKPTLVHFADGRWILRTRRGAASSPTGAAPPSSAAGDVIDIDAREVRDVPRIDPRRD